MEHRSPICATAQAERVCVLGVVPRVQLGEWTSMHVRLPKLL
jgi:hypothetical protein